LFASPARLGLSWPGGHSFIIQNPRRVFVEYRAQEVFQSAAAVAGKGWKIVKLHGVKDDATCTCHKGSECPTPGKHPAGGADWQSRATSDEDQISDWFDYSDENESHRVNVGVRLGKTSGIIDVEVDGPEAEETLKTKRIFVLWH
jgi:hypothetical protein